MPATAPEPNTSVSLLRRWVIDYFNRHDATAAREFISSDYTLRIGDVTFAGRDTAWLPAVDQQMQLFPGLGMTVHQVIAGEDWVAASFSEHGASAGRAACWSGVAIYRHDGERLTGCVAQEDYFTRQRQLKSGSADAVAPPAVAPWDTPIGVRNRDAEATVADWLSQSWPKRPTSVCCDDEYITGAQLEFEVKSQPVVELYSAGPHVAFHVRQLGTYVGGFSDFTPGGQTAFLDCNGIVEVLDKHVVKGRVIRDRIGLRSRLRKGRSDA
jgi:hypothetical protein